MEGDLLGLGLEQPTVSNKTPQEIQQFESSFLQLQPPLGQIQHPSQFPPAAVQLAPPVAVQLAPPVAVQLAPPVANVQRLPAQYQHAIQQQESAAMQQPPSTTKPVQATITSSKDVEPTVVPIIAQNTANSSARTNEVWKPSTLHDEPQDPVLREIKEKFSGRWKLIRSDPYDEYLKDAGVGFFARKLAISRAPEQEIAIKGNKIHIDSHSTFHNQLHVFALEESVENLVETTRQSVFCSYKDGKLILLMTPLEPGLNRTQEVQRYISQHGELVATYTCGNSTCRRYFARMADQVGPLNIVG